MKPGDFYMGMSEFLSVLIPGFIVTIVLSIYFELIEFRSFGANEWAMLLVAAYIIGHILFALGSYWDDLYDKVRPQGNDKLLDKISQIRLHNIEQDCSSINKYKWSRAVLSKIHPEGYAEVLRKEADSKLFRSMILPLLMCAVIVSIKLDIWWSLMALGIAFISFWRYREQRFKACKIAYTHIIVLHQLDKLFVRDD